VVASHGSLTVTELHSRVAFGTRLRARTERGWEAARSAFGWKPLLIVLALGVIVRVYALVTYEPAWLMSVDSIRYARIAPPGPFDDVWAPAGYPAFLALFRQISNNLSFTIAVQHLLGIASALLVFATVRRVAPRWVALVPAAVLLLGGDYIFLETTLLAESYMTFLICAALYAAIRALDDPHPLAWLASASFLGGMAALARSNALVIPVVVALWALIVFHGPLLRRGVVLAASLIPAAALIAIYAVVATSGGHFAGLTDEANLDLYSRVAPFADCNKFDPPAGTERLCQSTPPSQRPSTFWYAWDPTSPGRTNFGGMDPRTNGPLGKWARAAIVGQPFAYAKAVTKDMVRYIDPSVGNRSVYAGVATDAWGFGTRDAQLEQTVGSQIAKRYDGVLPMHTPGRNALEAYQTSTRLGGLFIALFSVLTILGVSVARGKTRIVLALFAVVAFVLYLGPVLTFSYSLRYGVPPQALLAGAAAMGTWALARRMPDTRLVRGREGAWQAPLQ